MHTMIEVVYVHPDPRLCSTGGQYASLVVVNTQAECCSVQCMYLGLSVNFRQLWGLAYTDTHRD